MRNSYRKGRETVRGVEIDFDDKDTMLALGLKAKLLKESVFAMHFLEKADRLHGGVPVFGQCRARTTVAISHDTAIAIKLLASCLAMEQRRHVTQGQAVRIAVDAALEKQLEVGGEADDANALDARAAREADLEDAGGDREFDAADPSR